MKGTFRYRESATAWAFILPVLFLLIVYNIYPIIYSFYISLTEWNGGVTTPKFIGISNYIKIFDNSSQVGRYFLISLKNTFVWTIIFSTVPVLLGLLIALMLNSEHKITSVYKVFYYMPMVLSFVVLGLIWKWIFVEDGLINSILGFLGIAPINWMGSPDLALYSVIIAASWRHIAYCMIIYLAGLKSVPLDLIEASKIDGATRFQQNLHVVIPLLRPSTTVIITTTLVSSFTVFDIVFAMTRGGPNGASDVIGSRMYQEAFWNMRFGESSAMAYVMFIIVAAVTIPYCIKQLQTNEEEL